MNLPPISPALLHSPVYFILYCSVYHDGSIAGRAYRHPHLLFKITPSIQGHRGAPNIVVKVMQDTVCEVCEISFNIFFSIKVIPA